MEAFSAFSGKVVPVGSPELDSVLGMYMNGRTTTTTVTGTGSADEPEQEQEEEVGEDLAGFLIKLGVKKICVVGLATDFWSVHSSLVGHEIRRLRYLPSVACTFDIAALRRRPWPR